MRRAAATSSTRAEAIDRGVDGLKAERIQETIDIDRERYVADSRAFERRPKPGPRRGPVERP